MLPFAFLTLGMYVVRGLICVSLQVVGENTHHDKVCVSVERRHECGYLSLVVDDVETLIGW